MTAIKLQIGNQTLQRVEKLHEVGSLSQHHAITIRCVFFNFQLGLVEVFYFFIL